MIRFLSCTLLLLAAIDCYALEYKLFPGESDIDGVRYYKLVVSNKSKIEYIDIALEGNSGQAKIREQFFISCPWGIANVATISMDSSTIDGNSSIVNYYAFDKNINNVFAKSYFFTEGNPKRIPLSLNKTICLSKTSGVKKSLRTGKDYIENSEVIEQGPFALKGVTDVDIKFVFNKNLTFVTESRSGEEIIAHYEDMDGSSARVLSVFFMKIKDESNIIALMSWGGDGKPDCYKIYAYMYNKNGKITENVQINNDPRLSGCNSKGNEFIYTDASKIKRYLIDKYNARK